MQEEKLTVLDNEQISGETKAPELYDDATQEAVRQLKETAASAKEDYRPYTTGEIVHDVIFFFVTVAVALQPLSVVAVSPLNRMR